MEAISARCAHFSEVGADVELHVWPLLQILGVPQATKVTHTLSDGLSGM